MLDHKMDAVSASLSLEKHRGYCPHVGVTEVGMVLIATNSDIFVVPACYRLHVGSEDLDINPIPVMGAEIPWNVWIKESSSEKRRYTPPWPF